MVLEGAALILHVHIIKSKVFHEHRILFSQRHLQYPFVFVDVNVLRFKLLDSLIHFCKCLNDVLCDLFGSLF